MVVSMPALKSKGCRFDPRLLQSFGWDYKPRFCLHDLVASGTFNWNTHSEFDMLNELPHDKTNKVTMHPAKTQISLGIRPVWSESSLCAQWVAKDPSFAHSDSEDSEMSFLFAVPTEAPGLVAGSYIEQPCPQNYCKVVQLFWQVSLLVLYRTGIKKNLLVIRVEINANVENLVNEAFLSKICIILKLFVLKSMCLQSLHPSWSIPIVLLLPNCLTNIHEFQSPIAVSYLPLILNTGIMVLYLVEVGYYR